MSTDRCRGETAYYLQTGRYHIIFFQITVH
jgi:hypothetical protein